MATPKQEVSDAPKSRTLSIRVSADLHERIRNAVYWTPGTSLAEVGQRALEVEISKLERANGGVFKPRHGEQLRRGRRAS